jgi:hypothetical protein
MLIIDPYRFQSDPFFANVALLVTGNSGSIVEESGGATVNALGTCAVSTGQVKFGTHSIRNPDSDSPVDATDGLVITDSVNTGRFTFAGQFTIEGWFYPIDLDNDADQSLMIGNDASNGTDRYVLDVRTDSSLGDAGRVRFRHGSTTIAQSAAGALVEDSWQHVAVTRDASDIVRIFINGVVVATSSAHSGSVGGVDGSGHANLKITVGIAFVNGDLNTYFDQIRITGNLCRYSGTFTPPTAPFPTV